MQAAWALRYKIVGPQPKVYYNKLNSQGYRLR